LEPTGSTRLYRFFATRSKTSVSLYWCCPHFAEFCQISKYKTSWSPRDRLGSIGSLPRGQRRLSVCAGVVRILPNFVKFLNTRLFGVHVIDLYRFFATRSKTSVSLYWCCPHFAEFCQISKHKTSWSPRDRLGSIGSLPRGQRRLSVCTVVVRILANFVKCLNTGLLGAHESFCRSTGSNPTCVRFVSKCLGGFIETF
jgi:hypothetical protein